MVEGPLQRLTNPDGRQNLSIAGLRLHSGRDPQLEARRFIQQAQTGAGTLLIVGLGWGYVVEAAAELPRSEREKIFFLEPSAEVYALLQREARWKELQALSPNLSASIHDLRQRLQGQGLRVVIHPAYARLAPDLGDEIEAALRGDVDAFTRRRFVRQWLWNALRRLSEGVDREFLCSPGAQTKPGYSAIYCGAGPGLLDDLALLKERAGDPAAFYWIVADSALGPVLRSGISPDLFVSVDSGAATHFHLSAGLRHRSGKLPPALTWLAGPTALESVCERTIYYRSSLPVDQALARGPLAGVPEWRNPSRNPAGLALLAAHSLGCSELILAGADFRSHGLQSHVPGTGYSEYAALRAARLFSPAGYRPGGYAVELSAKARVSFEGLNELSESLSVSLRPVGQIQPGGRAAARPIVWPLQRRSGAELRQWLAREWTGISAVLQQGSGLPAAAIARWRRMLPAS